MAPKKPNTPTTDFNNFFQRMNKLFRSGPSIQKKIKGYDYKTQYNRQQVQGNYGYKTAGPFGFGRNNSPFSTMGNYGLLDRMSNYSEYSQMEYNAEIAAALDILSEETVGGDDRGKCFHVYSKDHEIKKALDELFYDVINVEFNLRLWARNVVKYGDFFAYNEVIPDVGIISVIPIPVNEVEREEGFDNEDPHAVRFKWLTRGNQHLEAWQVSHFRLLGNDLFLPYGSSVLEPAKRAWRMLTMSEDAMLVYRLVRAPERRVFYIDVGNTGPNDIPAFMEAVKQNLRSNSVVDKQTGRMDQRFNPLDILDDYFIPVRGSQAATKIDTLAGGQNQTAIEDVQYLQSKMIAALKVPKPYLNFDENLSSKATLSQTDIRFARTISFIQKTLIAELNKLAMIHLFAKGFDGEDLINFELKLSNPSSVALLQKLELWASKFEIGGTAKETGLADVEWIRRNILEFTDEDILKIQQGLIKDKITETELEQVAVPEEPVTFKRTLDPFDPANQQSLQNQGNIDKSPPHQNNSETAQDIINRVQSYDEEGNPYEVELEPGHSPIKASPFLDREKRNAKRRVGQGGRSNLSMPDFSAMLSPKNKYNRDVYGKLESFNNKSFKDVIFEGEENEKSFDPVEKLLSIEKPLITKEMKSILNKFRQIHPKKRLLNEEQRFEIDIDLTDLSESKDNNFELDELILSENKDELRLKSEALSSLEDLIKEDE
jgi:hypothetical protein